MPADSRTATPRKPGQITVSTEPGEVQGAGLDEGARREPGLQLVEGRPRPRRKPGWLNAAANLPRPDEQWIADKLNRLERQAGADALESAMQEPGGLTIEVPRREPG